MTGLTCGFFKDFRNESFDPAKSQPVQSVVSRRRGREVEGTPLLREHAVKNCIKGSNPFVSAKTRFTPLPSLREARPDAETYDGPPFHA